MAVIGVYHEEVGGKDFPAKCMCCGTEADLVVVTKSFDYQPWWVLFFGVYVHYRNNLRMNIPMCRKHTNHWQIRSRYLWFGLTFWILLAVAFCLLGNEIPQNLALVALGISMFGFMVWFVVLMMLNNTAIQVLDMNEYRIRLENVHEEFASDWKLICKAIDRVREEEERLIRRLEEENRRQGRSEEP